MNLARPERLAAIDCGTNTFTMLVVDVLPEGIEGEGGRRWRECFRLRLPVRLGAGGFKAGMITPERFARGLDALGVMRECARNLGVGEVVLVGTSAEHCSQRYMYRPLVWKFLRWPRPQRSESLRM